MKEVEDKYFLRDVFLAGYKSIRETNIDFVNNLSVIIGKNAAGKTNFLLYLDKVLNYDFEDIYNFKSILKFNGKNTVLFEVSNNLSENIPNSKSTFLNKKYKFLIEINDIQTEYDSNSYPQLIESLEKKNFTCFSNLISHGTPMKYDMVDQPFTFTTDDKGRAFDLFSFISDLQQPYFIKSLLTAFLNEGNDFLDIRKSEATTIEKIKERLRTFIFRELDAIKPYLNNLSPIDDIRFSENYNVFESKSNEQFTISNLFIEFNVIGEWYPFSSLSDGTKRLFYIISEVAAADNFFFTEGRFGKSNGKGSRIILIEEPELGIHPHQLHMLMLFLKEQSRTKQIIITTHSPQVLDILNEDELDGIILATHNQKQGTLLRHLSDKEIKKARKYIQDEFLSDYWVYSDLEEQNDNS